MKVDAERSTPRQLWLSIDALMGHQLIEHLNLWSLRPDAQSAHRANHSTETAVLRVLSDILDALDGVIFRY